MTRKPRGRALALRRASSIERLFRQDVFENAEWDAWAKCEQQADREPACSHMIERADNGVLFCFVCDAEFIDDTVAEALDQGRKESEGTNVKG